MSHFVVVFVVDNFWNFTKKKFKGFFFFQKKIQNFCIYGKFSLSKTILLLILAYFSYKKENPPRVRNSKKRRKQFFSREISVRF